MNPLRILAALPLLCVGVCAQTGSGPQLPDRPAIALSNYKDSWVPVVGVDAGGPVALDNGGKVSLAPNARIMLSVGDRYADGFVTISDAHLTNAPGTTDPDMAEAMDYDMKSTVENYEADLTSDTDIPKAFALFVLPLPPLKADSPPRIAVLARSIGDLQAGKQTHLSAKLPKIGPADGPDWIALVYYAGRQVRSTGMSSVLPQYFDGVEATSLKRRIAERVAKGADAPIAVFREMPLGLNAALEAKYHGSTVKVMVDVNAEGQVVSAKPEGVSDPDLSAAVSRGFGTWLFVPPVKEGSSAPGSAVIPLKM
jgi:hypothetical protein